MPTGAYHRGVPNRLAGETSPYLLQHAHNPVDWYPWGPEALDRARELDRPIFLSIGYAACHWCHVMERESFEDEATARLLNEHFVAIKVDREERPDLDSIYMGAVQAMTGSGGWPMSVFLTPDGSPFYGGTYFPDRPRHGMPSFSQVLEGVSGAWANSRADVVAAGQRLVAALVEGARGQTGADTRTGAAGAGGAGDAGAGGWTGPAIDEGLFAAVDAALDAGFDRVNTSWGGAPKFPQPMTLEYMLRRIASGDRAGEWMVRATLDRMADGGIRDQLGGGFHRYATDANWLVPHFEQMLYDNALLARVYLHGWAVLGSSVGSGSGSSVGSGTSERYREVAMGVLDYILRELTTSDGAFAASQDADTEGLEGMTFTWRAAEIREVLGDLAPAFTAAYGVTEDGNWEGVSILSRVTSRADQVAELTLAGARARLLERRATRPQPARDGKALAAWNGLAIAALAEAGRLLGEERYTFAATRAAETVTAGLLDADGALSRSWKDGRAVGQGTLEDYADLAEGLLALYETTFEERWFTIARALMDRVLERFTDADGGGFFDTGDDHERLITRPKDLQDNAVPAGGSMAATVLLRLAAWTGEARYSDAAELAIGAVVPLLPRYPTAFGQWLVAATFLAADISEIAIVGDPTDPDTRSMLEEARSRWRPFTVLAAAAPEAIASPVVPLLADRPAIDGRPTAYVCRGFVCDLPVTDAAALRTRLDC